MKDGKYSVFQNIGNPSTFNTAYSQKPKSFIKLQLWKPKDKNQL